jgi:hypothetical protein
MTNPSRSLLPLCACFRGVVPPNADWSALLALANHTLTTPALIEFVRSQPAAVPDEVASYIEEIHARNAIRNDRLLVQLEEAVLALNRAGITPVLVKGAARLATCPPSERALRLLSDLDLVIRPGEIDATLKALAAIGYITDRESDPDHPKWYVDLRRAQDAGMIDLHEALPGEVFLDQTMEEMRAQFRPVELGAAHALVPSPALQALVLVLHDQFQDRDYWIASIDLRHLLDLKSLFSAPHGLRDDDMLAMASSALVRNAYESQRLLLSRLLDVAWPKGRRQRLMPRIQVWRQLLRARHSAFRSFVLPIGLINLPDHLARSATRKPAARSGSSPRTRPRRFPKLSTFLVMLSLSRRYRAGKV